MRRGETLPRRAASQPKGSRHRPGRARPGNQLGVGGTAPGGQRAGRQRPRPRVLVGGVRPRLGHAGCEWQGHTSTTTSICHEALVAIPSLGGGPRSSSAHQTERKQFLVPIMEHR